MCFVWFGFGFLFQELHELISSYSLDLVLFSVSPASHLTALPQAPPPRFVLGQGHSLSASHPTKPDCSNNDLSLIREPGMT